MHSRRPASSHRGSSASSCASPYAPTYRTQVGIAELPCRPPGSRHSLASLKVALEDHVLRSAGYERGSRPLGPAPSLYFTPVNHEASRAPPFGSGGFWNGVAARGAFWVCSFQWPIGSVPVRATSTADSPAAPDRAWLNSLAFGSRRGSWRACGSYPRTCPQRPPALFPLDLDPSCCV